MKVIELTVKEVEALSDLLNSDMERMGFPDDIQEVLEEVQKKIDSDVVVLTSTSSAYKYAFDYAKKMYEEENITKYEDLVERLRKDIYHIISEKFDSGLAKDLINEAPGDFLDDM